MVSLKEKVATKTDFKGDVDDGNRSHEEVMELRTGMQKDKGCWTLQQLSKCQCINFFPDKKRNKR